MVAVLLAHQYPPAALQAPPFLLLNKGVIKLFLSPSWLAFQGVACPPKSPSSTDVRSLLADKVSSCAYQAMLRYLSGQNILLSAPRGVQVGVKVAKYQELHHF